jgi:RHS repeat-associated protein
VAKQTPTATIHYAASGLFEKNPVSGAVTKYYRVGGVLVAMRDVGGLHFLGHDHLGTTTLQTSATGAVEAASLRAPYGDSWWSSGALATDLQYTGVRSLEGSLGSLYSLGARFYSPVLGRFLSPDPIVPLTEPQSLDPYGYARANPLGLVDPTGLLVSSDGGGACICLPPESPPTTTSRGDLPSPPRLPVDLEPPACSLTTCQNVVQLEPWYVRAVRAMLAQLAPRPVPAGPLGGPVTVFNAGGNDSGDNSAGSKSGGGGGPGGSGKELAERVREAIQRATDKVTEGGVKTIRAGMSVREGAVYDRAPRLGSRYEGSSVHRGVADIASEFDYSPNRGADYTHRESGLKVELTTEKQLASHKARYGDDVLYVVWRKKL